MPKTLKGLMHENANLEALWKGIADDPDALREREVTRIHALIISNDAKIRKECFAEAIRITEEGAGEERFDVFSPSQARAVEYANVAKDAEHLRRFLKSNYRVQFENILNYTFRLESEVATLNAKLEAFKESYEKLLSKLENKQAVEEPKVVKRMEYLYDGVIGDNKIGNVVGWFEEGCGPKSQATPDRDTELTWRERDRDVVGHVFQYYYRTSDCPAADSRDASCCCWHNEGTGPQPSLAYGSGLTSWRVQPLYILEDV